MGKDRIARDTDDAARFTTGGTPWFFINGRSLSGAQPIEVFKQAIDEELRKANALLAAGTPRGELYAALTKAGLDKKTEPPPAKPDPDADIRIRVDVTGAPARGPADAPITIVEWSDFQCPFCARAEETLTRLRQEYPDQIRFVWRDLPLPFHDQARPAAIAARAAGAQGKFWAMHDRLYADHVAPLGRERFERDAGELGLDGKRFRAALDAEEGKSGIDADLVAATKAGATGTPTFFINGKVLTGAQPYETFKARIDDELKVTEAMIAKGTPRARLYAALMKDALPVRPPAKAAKNDDDDEPGPEADTKIYPVKPGDAPAKGPANAPLVLVVFSDFQCPFCKRVEPTLAEVEKHYPGKVRVVWKNYPLPFHANAWPAAEAAMAADAQGKFWPMHDRLFANNTALDRESLENYAAAVGLDLPRFRADLDAGRWKARIEADKQEGSDARRRRDAGGLHQRPQDSRRLPVRDLPEDRRRRARQARGPGRSQVRSQNDKSRPLVTTGGFVKPGARRRPDASRYLMKRISWNVGSGQRASSTTPSRRVGRLAHLQHRRQHRAAEVLGLGQHAVAPWWPTAVSRPARPGLQLADELADLLEHRRVGREARAPSRRWRSRPARSGTAAPPGGSSSWRSWR